MFGRPQAEIASQLCDQFQKAAKVDVVVGFITDAGVAAIWPGIQNDPARLRTLVAGAGTFKAYQALDHLITDGVPSGNVWVHLGYSQAVSKRYRPMLHSKVYYFERDDGTAAALVGSHNLTSFALDGQNGEVSILLEGPAFAQQFEDIRRHIHVARQQATPFDSALKEAYAWWAAQYLSGLSSQAGGPTTDETQGRKTVIVMAERSEDELPGPGESFYFEMPPQVGQIVSLGDQIHLYLFNRLPPSSRLALDNLGNARAAFRASIGGVMNQGSARELETNWHVENIWHPVLLRVQPPFRPRTNDVVQQVQGQITGYLDEGYEYFFDRRVARWRPDLDLTQTVIEQPRPDREAFLAPRIQSDDGKRSQVSDIKRITRKTEIWARVRGFERELESASRGRGARDAPMQARPESGSYVLLSVRRRRN